MEKYTVEDMKKMSKEDLIDILIDAQNQIMLFKEQLAVANNNRFGSKSEKLKPEDDDQIHIFNEAEALQDEKHEEEPATEIITYTRKKRPVGKKEEDLSKFQHKIVNHEIPEEVLDEKFGKDGWKRLPDEVYTTLEAIPAQYIALEHHIGVYAGKKDDTIIKAEHPKELMKNSIATPSLMAAILNAKYTNAMPLYRIGQEFERNEINISRQTMANWTIKCAELYLSLLYDRMHQILCKEHVVQADETPVIVTKDRKTKTGKSYMWVYRTGELKKEQPIILYDYRPGRDYTNPEEFLKGFEGTVMCDAHTAYHKLGALHPEIKIANCLVHARRHFANSVKANKDKSNPRFGVTIAEEALNKLAKIFDEEGKLKELSSEERLKKRQTTVKPLIEDFFAWVKDNRAGVLSKSETGKGLEYCINQEKFLMEFLNDGDVPLHNSATEQAIRPFTIGRKNFVMIDTKAGAQSSAIIYSIVETAKANNIKPYEYFKHLLTEIPRHMDDKSLDFLTDLLPWSDNLPQECKKQPRD